MSESIVRRPPHSTLLSTLLIAGAVWTLTAMSSGVVVASSQAADDERAIKQLITADYPNALDSADWKAYGALFTEDAELKTGNATTKGQKTIEENFKARASRSRPAVAAAPATPGAQPVTKHVVTDLNYKIAGDTATSTANWQTVSILDGKTTVAYAGHYVDKLKKVNGVWKFQSREITNQQAPGSAAAPAPAAAPSAR